MKKIVISVLGLLCATAIVTNAQNATTNTTTTTAAPAASTNATPKAIHSKLTPEQIAQRKELVTKYDTNKDGRLSKDEVAAMSAEDKAAWEKLTPIHKKKAAAAQ
jgi:hypothetical protein